MKKSYLLKLNWFCILNISLVDINILDQCYCLLIYKAYLKHCPNQFVLVYPIQDLIRTINALSEQ